ncbi:transporter substrate-binding domain-containing protein [Maridesulfovibrio zosterae]|uniref:transporter substrate-binding domain-containing protein n=1 Tax=Maridesulfovibrio zosterae TaxID=82171 RepID=UPI000486F9BB|nr:transporter substrate-binding domain-containing protein [Maridesulfovibrio zosterae]
MKLELRYMHFGFILSVILLFSLFPAHSFARLIIVEGDYDYPPYEFLDNGIPSGFNIDIIRAVAKAEALDIKINLRNWSNVVSDLKSGKCDVVTGMVKSEERSSFFDFSIPHNILSHSIFVHADSNIKQLEDLVHSEIIVQKSDIMHEYALKNFTQAKIVAVDSQGEAMLLLASREHDAALLGKLQTIFQLKRDGLTNIKSVGSGFGFGEYCFAVRKDDIKLLGQLNEGLNLIKKTGEYDEIYKKWFGIHERRNNFREIIYYVVLVLIPVILFLVGFIIWTWMLRKSVKQKTKELTLELHERNRAEEELKKAQGYLASVIDSMPSVLIGVDNNCNITHWNREAARVYESEHRDVIGFPLDLAVPQLAFEIDLVREALKTGKKQIDSKLRGYGNNRTVYQDMTIYPLVVNNIEGAVIRIDDITERLNFEQMVMQSEKMVSIGGLAAGMAHEINNPLAVIVGHAQNIQRRTSVDLVKNINMAEECGTSIDVIQTYMHERGITRMLNGILESGNRAAKIVMNMLSFSRKSDNVFNRQDIAAVLDRTLELASSDYDLKKEYDFKRIEIIREYEPGIPPVYCEENEIQQVFLNIFRNAAEAMSGKVYSTVGARFILRVRRASQMVRIEIEDNGPGMDEDTQKRIFEPFYTTKDVGKGTGLGLSVSYFIITDHHKGTFEVESMLGHWTRFIIKLPTTFD